MRERRYERRARPLRSQFYDLSGKNTASIKGAVVREEEMEG